MTSLPEGPWRTIVVDPPWPYKDSLPGKGRGAAKHYPLMTIREIAQLPVTSVADPDGAHLYLWTTNAFMEDAYGLVRQWGFAAKTLLTWVKIKNGARLDPEELEESAVRMGLGRSWRNATEHCLFATRGRLGVLRHDRLNVLVARCREHSAKPDVFYERVREMSSGPRLELFARVQREGFTAWGNEIQTAEIQATV